MPVSKLEVLDLWVCRVWDLYVAGDVVGQERIIARSEVQDVSYVQYSGLSQLKAVLNFLIFAFCAVLSSFSWIASVDIS